MGKIDYRVRCYETNKEGHLFLFSIFNLLQDTISYTTESIGATREYYKNKERAWVLLDYEIDIFKDIFFLENIHSESSPYSFKKIIGYRRLLLLDKQDKLLIEAKAKCVFINTKTRRIARVDEDELKLYSDLTNPGEELIMVENEVKDSFEFIKEKHIKVQYTDIDKNNHLNNAAYIKYVEDMIDVDFYEINKINKMRVSFKVEAVFNDNIIIKMYTDNSSKYVFEFIRDGKIITIITFFYKKNKIL